MFRKDGAFYQRIKANHVHVEGIGAHGQEPAHVAKANNTECAAGELAAFKLISLPVAIENMIAGEGKTDESLGKLGVLAGVNRFPTRVKCAILSWHALHSALQGGSEVISTETNEGQKLT